METKRTFYLTVTGVAVIISLAVILFAVFRRSPPGGSGSSPLPSGAVVDTRFGKLVRFSSDQEFKEYMQNSQSPAGMYGGVLNTIEDRAVFKQGAGRMSPEMAVPSTGGGQAPERVSQTNVQVLGIDEPDILKIDGENAFYSMPAYRVYGGPVPLMEKRVEPMSVPVGQSASAMPPVYQEPQSNILTLKMFPPQSMGKLGALPVSGDLLLSGNMLVVFNEMEYGKRSVEGWDVSDPARPVKKWSNPYMGSSYKVQARLSKGKLYLVTRIDTGGDYTCPVRPFAVSVRGGFVPCTEIYHPVNPVSNDTLYTASRINVKDGTVEKNLSFTGSSSDSTIYMSRDNLYIAYHYSGDLVQIMSAFVAQNRDIFSASVADRLSKLAGYDLSVQAKMYELQNSLSRFMAGMDNDKRLAFENNLKNRMTRFMASHARELEKTGIAKIGIDDFAMQATGDVPGNVINQFALDEYEGNLRVATTVGQNSWFGPLGQLTQSFSDVYVLDGGLREIGSVRDLGKTERIYSVRFMAGRGYVVTFRQTDPFYVLDLSNARSPQLKGELKIPGFSSYLHPLTEDLLVGIGQENGNVKLSLFDVASPENPAEVDKYSMSEYWSEAQNNHHAFLADEKHEVFFLPGSKGGYVFSYAGRKINLVKAVADYQVQRATYVNDYLYIIGQNGIQAFNEKDWSKAGELSL